MLAFLAKRYTMMLAALCVAAAAALSPASAAGTAFDIPPWFKESFLDIREDVREAATEGKRLIVYFGQDGCPYCRELMQVNFAAKETADFTRRHFNAVAINMWGDREVTWTNGRILSEKQFAAALNVQFTPTLLFFDEKGTVILRLNGYYPPHRFRAALGYIAGRQEPLMPFAVWLERHAREPASGRLHAETYFLGRPYRLAAARRPQGKPLLVLFEQRECAACDRLHERGLRDPAVRELIGRFDVARLELFGSAPVETPDGKSLTESQWGRALGLAYTPSLVFFDTAGREVFRMESFLQPFHLASGLEYVASGAYLRQPSFQRYLQSRAERIRSTGGRVDLW
jgi:thioredoxin-related protein